jgi:hypothetical protein
MKRVTSSFEILVTLSLALGVALLGIAAPNGCGVVYGIFRSDDAGQT